MDFCVTIVNNYAMGCVAVFLAVVFLVVYIGFGRALSVARKRAAIKDRALVQCQDIYRALRIKLDTLLIKKHDFTAMHRSPLRLCVFVAGSLVITFIMTLFGVLWTMQGVFYSTFILWRADIGVVVADAEEFVQSLLTWVDKLSDLFAVFNLGQLVKALATPFVTIINFLSSLRLADLFGSLNVSCSGATASINVFVNFAIIWLVIAIIQSQFLLIGFARAKLCGFVFNQYSSAEFYARSKASLGELNSTILQVLVMRLVNTAIIYKVALRYLLTLISLSAFFPLHPWTPACSSLDPVGFDTALAIMSTVVMYCSVYPVIYTIGQICTPPGKENTIKSSLLRRLTGNCLRIHIFVYSSPKSSRKTADGGKQDLRAQISGSEIIDLINKQESVRASMLLDETANIRYLQRDQGVVPRDGYLLSFAPSQIRAKTPQDAYEVVCSALGTHKSLLRFKLFSYCCDVLNIDALVRSRHRGQPATAATEQSSCGNTTFLVRVFFSRFGKLLSRVLSLFSLELWISNVDFALLHVLRSFRDKAERFNYKRNTLAHRIGLFVDVCVAEAYTTITGSHLKVAGRTSWSNHLLQYVLAVGVILGPVQMLSRTGRSYWASLFLWPISIVRILMRYLCALCAPNGPNKGRNVSLSLKNATLPSAKTANSGNIGDGMDSNSPPHLRDGEGDLPTYSQSCQDVMDELDLSLQRHWLQFSSAIRHNWEEIAQRRSPGNALFFCTLRLPLLLLLFLAGVSLVFAMLCVVALGPGQMLTTCGRQYALRVVDKYFTLAEIALGFWNEEKADAFSVDESIEDFCALNGINGIIESFLARMRSEYAARVSEDNDAREVFSSIPLDFAAVPGTQRRKIKITNKITRETTRKEFLQNKVLELVVRLGDNINSIGVNAAVESLVLNELIHSHGPEASQKFVPELIRLADRLRVILQKTRESQAVVKEVFMQELTSKDEDSSNGPGGAWEAMEKQFLMNKQAPNKDVKQQNSTARRGSVVAAGKADFSARKLELEVLMCDVKKHLSENLLSPEVFLFSEELLEFAENYQLLLGHCACTDQSVSANAEDEEEGDGLDNDKIEDGLRGGTPSSSLNLSQDVLDFVVEAILQKWVSESAIDELGDLVSLSVRSEVVNKLYAMLRAIHVERLDDSGVAEKEERRVFDSENFLNTMVSTRAVLFMVVPALTVLSIYSAFMSGSPLVTSSQLALPFFFGPEPVSTLVITKAKQPEEEAEAKDEETNMDDGDGEKAAGAEKEEGDGEEDSPAALQDTLREALSEAVASSSGKPPPVRASRLMRTMSTNLSGRYVDDDFYMFVKRGEAKLLDYEYPGFLEKLKAQSNRVVHGRVFLIIYNSLLFSVTMTFYICIGAESKEGFNAAIPVGIAVAAIVAMWLFICASIICSFGRLLRVEQGDWDETCDLAAISLRRLCIFLYSPFRSFRSSVGRVGVDPYAAIGGSANRERERDRVLELESPPLLHKEKPKPLIPASFGVSVLGRLDSLHLLAQSLHRSTVYITDSSGDKDGAEETLTTMSAAILTKPSAAPSSAPAPAPVSAPAPALAASQLLLQSPTAKLKLKPTPTPINEQHLRQELHQALRQELRQELQLELQQDLQSLERKFQALLLREETRGREQTAIQIEAAVEAARATAQATAAAEAATILRNREEESERMLLQLTQREMDNYREQEQAKLSALRGELLRELQARDGREAERHSLLRKEVLVELKDLQRTREQSQSQSQLLPLLQPLTSLLVPPPTNERRTRVTMDSSEGRVDPSVSAFSSPSSNRVQHQQQQQQHLQQQQVDLSRSHEQSSLDHIASDDLPSAQNSDDETAEPLSARAQASVSRLSELHRRKSVLLGNSSRPVDTLSASSPSPQSLALEAAGSHPSEAPHSSPQNASLGVFSSPQAHLKPESPSDASFSPNVSLWSVSTSTAAPSPNIQKSSGSSSAYHYFNA